MLDMATLVLAILEPEVTMARGMLMLRLTPSTWLPHTVDTLDMALAILVTLTLLPMVMEILVMLAMAIPVLAILVIPTLVPMDMVTLAMLVLAMLVLDLAMDT